MEEKEYVLEPQDVYNAAYNYALGEEYKDKYINAKIPYDANWIYSTDARIVQALEFGLDDGEIAKNKYKNQKQKNLKKINSSNVIKVEEATENHKQQKKMVKATIAAILGGLGIGGAAMFREAETPAEKEPVKEERIVNTEIEKNIPEIVSENDLEGRSR